MENFLLVAFIALFVLQIVVISRLDKVKQLERKVFNLEREIRQLKMGGTAPQAAQNAPQTIQSVPNAVPSMAVVPETAAAAEVSVPAPEMLMQDADFVAPEATISANVQMPQAAPIQESASAPQAAPIQQSVSAPQAAPIQQSVPAPQAAPIPQSAPAPQAAPAWQNGPMPQGKPVSQKKTAAPRESIESKIGKTLMAGLASVLIFFSFVFFAGIAFSYMTDGMKLAIMFAVSIIIAVVGIVKMPKKDEEYVKKYGTFFTALAACGIGAIYITALVGYFGFKCIALAPFIIMIALWILLTIFLSYKRSPIFAYICNVGLIIATFLTGIQFESSLLAFVLYTICLAALYLINRHDNFNKDCIYFIQYPIVFIGITLAVDTQFVPLLVFAAMVCAVFVLENLLYEMEQKHSAANIITIILNIAAVIRILCSEDNDRIAYITIAILIVFMALYFVRYYRQNRLLFYLMYVLAYVIAAIAFATTEQNTLIAMIPFTAFLITGYFLKDFVFRIGGYIALLVSFFVHMIYYDGWTVLGLYLALFIAATVIMVIVDYHMVDKYILTFMFIVYFIALIISREPDISIRFAIFAALSVFMNSKLYHLDLQTKESEILSVAFGYVMNALMMLWGLSLIGENHDTPELYQWVIISFITLGLACIHVGKLFRMKLPELLVGFYICIKYSTLIFVILHRLETESFIVSVVGILIAITCIILGFMRSHRSFRLYGLIVSLICVVKLILFDIQYDSYLLRPVGFFIAGILCFAISFIYSKIEKNYSLNKTEQEND